MHDHGNARATEAGGARASARTPVTAPPTRLPGLLGLQTTVGNAAVVQMLRRAGHPWVQPDQHQHTAGCGHRTDRPAVQRSTVHDIPRTSRSLDEAIHTDMEARPALDFTGVRGHDDSAAGASAAEVGARAHTSGDHAVVGGGGGGGDEHTPAHASTHAIQQHRGPVAGTDNAAGIKVSDPSGRFEREAEADASRAPAAEAAAGLREGTVQQAIDASTQRVGGSAVVNAALVQCAAAGPDSAPAAARPPAVAQRVEDGPGSAAGSEPDPVAESEYRLGIAATLERTINDDVKDRLGADGLHLSLGGGGGVAALRAERPVQDLDLRLHISGAQGSDPEFRREVIAYLQALLQDEVDRTTDGTTVRGTFGDAEVSVTLGEVPTQTRNMHVHGSSAQVPLTVVASLRLFTDKVSAFARRKEKAGEDLVEKRQRDARDLLTLYPQITAERGLAEVLIEHANDNQLIHQGLSNAGQFRQQLDRYKNAHPDRFDDQQWTRLREIARTLVDVAREQRASKAGPTAQQADGAEGPSGTTSLTAHAHTGTEPGAMGKKDRKAAKQARRQQKLAERPPAD